MTTLPGPDGFADAVLARCPTMTAEDAVRLRTAVAEALAGHPMDEWATRFADLIIDRREESFARPFFERSVSLGAAQVLGWAQEGPVALVGKLEQRMPSDAAREVAHAVFEGMADAATVEDARRP